MRIALIGGTGAIGAGLALRWAKDTDHEIVIGSRDPERAREAAAEYQQVASEHGSAAKVTGFENAMAADRAAVIILAVPPYHIAATIEAIAEQLSAGDVLISPAAGLRRDDAGFHSRPPSAGSVTQLAAEVAPDEVAVVGAFQNLAAGRLADLEAPLEVDTLVLGDDEDAVATTMDLAADIEGLRPVYAGGIGLAAEVEGLTAVLINVAEANAEMADLGVRFR
jgi:NADPH-dependent F420 reductase